MVTYISLVARGSWLCPSDVLVVAEVIDALCLAQIAQQQLALVFWLIGGR